MSKEKNPPVGRKKEPSDVNVPSEALAKEGAKEGEGKKKYSENLKKQLEECQKQRDDYLAGWQRAKADFLNYKKDETARMTELLKYGIAGLLANFLPILDNFEKAEKETPADLKNNQYFQGFLQIKKQVQDFLKSQGVTVIESIGKKVDLNFHEIVGEVETKDKEPGTIVEEVQKGYLIEDKLLRVAKVKITK